MGTKLFHVDRQTVSTKLFHADRRTVSTKLFHAVRRTVGTKLFHADRKKIDSLTDITKLIIAFRTFESSPQNTRTFLRLIVCEQRKTNIRK